LKTKISSIKRAVNERIVESQFNEIAQIITEGKNSAYSAVNEVLIATYWWIGQYINEKMAAAEWGDGIVRQLADYLKKHLSDPKGFSDKNLWRMKLFYETYAKDEKLSPLVRQLGWTQHLIILSRTKSAEEREYYLRLAIKERYTKRELERQIDCCLFERTIASLPKISTALKDTYPSAATILRDSYTLDFFCLPPVHFEADIRKGIVSALKHFLIEFGRDFAFVGEEYRVQVGLKDFSIDLLFYHRELQCLVAFELKLDEFKPEHLGKLSFYLEALDRDGEKMKLVDGEFFAFYNKKVNNVL
jgi:predicted nuclease of restriction endonuclease-like (RecB) superfamily